MGGPPAPPPLPDAAAGAEPPSTFREPAKKTIGEGYEKRELRKLTPEEKARRKVVWNIVMGGGGMLFIAFVGWLMWPARRKRRD